MLTERANAICLLKILKEHSDENHVLGMSEIIRNMSSLYGIKVDRRTVYSSVALLIELGYDIATYEETKKGYYLRARELEPAEIRLLTDAVYSFKGISAKQTCDLTAKLQMLLSTHLRKQYHNLTAVKPESKTQNKEVFYSIELLDEAISRKVKVSFDYLQYGFDKKLVSRRKQRYLVNPYGLSFTNEEYYLICNYDYFDKISFYRIDRIRNIELTEEKLKPAPKGFDPSEFAKHSIYAFGGKAETVTLQCCDDIIDHVIDRFGTDIKIERNEDGTFKVKLHAAPKGIKFWALQFLPYCEIISPEWLRNEIAESVKKGYNRYLK